MTLRESFNNAIRSDRPESPTDIAFLFLVFILGELWIYKNVVGGSVIDLAVIVTFAGTLKAIKVASDKQKQR